MSLLPLKRKRGDRFLSFPSTRSIWRWRYFVKVLLSILLGTILLTSLVGVSYATPTMQPVQGSSCDPNSPNYNGTPCGDHNGGNENPPQHGCTPVGQKGTDAACCFTGRSTPDTPCCTTGITPQSSEPFQINTDNPVSC